MSSYVSATLRRLVAERAAYLCEYCLLHEVGRPKAAKTARFSYPGFGPRHQMLVPVSVAIRFRDA